MNKSFKDRLRIKWDEWISYEFAATYTRGGKRQRASYVTMCEWILQAWDDVPVSAIRNWFLKAGLQIYNNTIQPFTEEISDLENEDLIEDTTIMRLISISLILIGRNVETSLTGLIRWVS